MKKVMFEGEEYIISKGSGWMSRDSNGKVHTYVGKPIYGFYWRGEWGCGGRSAHVVPIPDYKPCANAKGSLIKIPD